MIRQLRAALAVLCAYLIASPSFGQTINTLPVVSASPLDYQCGYSHLSPFGAQCSLISSIISLATNFSSVVTFPAPSSGPPNGSIILTPGAAPVGTPPNGSMWCTGVGCFAVVAGSIMSLGTIVPSTGAGGTSGQIQYNNSSVLAGIPGFTWSGSVLTLPSGTVFPSGTALTNPSIVGTATGFGGAPLITYPSCDNGASWLIGTALTLYCAQATASASDNVGVGTITLGSITSGCCNVAAGSETMRHASSASYNECSGFEACHILTTGGHNVAHGLNALANETTGGSNTAIGSSAGGNQQGGSSNTDVGVNSAPATTTAQNSVCVGAGACPTITSGNNNVSIGPSNAGYGITTGHGNVWLGGQGATLGAAINDSVSLADGDGNLVMQYLVGNGFIADSHPHEMPSFASTTALAGTPFTLGGSTIVGSGASAVCASGHVCDSISGEITFTTGTGVSANGLAVTVNFALTRAADPACVVSPFNGATPVAAKFTDNSTSALAISSVANLTSSTAYTLDYVCGGD